MSHLTNTHKKNASSALKLLYGYHARLKCGRLFGSSSG